MMGRLNRDQGQLFYSFCLDDVVPSDHRVREIAAVLELSWVHAEAPYYPSIGRRSIPRLLNNLVNCDRTRREAFPRSPISRARLVQWSACESPSRPRTRILSSR